MTLGPIAPNPFRQATRIRFGLARTGSASLEIFDPAGRLVAKPIDRASLAPGYHTLTWDGTTSAGERAPSGMYFCRLVSDEGVLTRRVVRLE